MYVDNNQFSNREKDVIQFLLQGKSNKQIALELEIANRTVEFHLSNIYAKLNVNSRSEAILKLTESGLRESTGGFQVKSTVDNVRDSTEDGFKSMLRRIPVKKLYIFIGGVLAMIIIVMVIFINSPAPKLEATPTAFIGQISTTSVDTPTAAALFVSTEIPPPANIIIPPHTVNGYTASIKSYYVDTANVTFQLRITGGNTSFGDPNFYSRLGGVDLYDENGNLINTSGGSGSAIDPALIQIDLVPVTLLTGDHFKGQLAFDLFDAPAYDQTVAQFRFDFDLPIYPALIFHPKQAVTVNALEMLLDQVTVTPTFTQVYVCFPSPSYADWNIGSQSTLQVGEQEATPYNFRLLFDSALGGDRRAGSEPYWVPPVKNGRCIKSGFPIGSSNPTSLILTIPQLEKSEPDILLTNQLAINYPGLSEQQAYYTYLEEQGNISKGAWVFKME